MQKPSKLTLEHVRNELRRRSLLRFVQDSQPGYSAGWVHADICARLERFSEAVARRESPRLILAMPPRHGKSFIATERFPVWHLGRHPDHQVVAASYGVDLSIKFSRRARELASDYGGRVFPGLELAGDRKAMQEWETHAGGGYKAVGVGSALTGSGADVLIVDDPIKDLAEALSERKREAVLEWWQSTAYTRVMPGGGILVIMTRWHEADLVGHLLEQAAADGEQWELAVYPAIAEVDDEHRKAGEPLHPERYDLEALGRIRKAVGGRVWDALYQQRPSMAAGDVFKRDWLQYYRKLPERFDDQVLSFDCTFKGTEEADFVAGQGWGRKGADFYMFPHALRERLGLPGTLEAVRAMARRYPRVRSKLVEDKANGPAVIQMLRKEIPGLVAVNPEGGKVVRAAAVSPLWEARNVWLPHPELLAELGLPDWVSDFVEELVAFPKGKHDDQVDAMTQALVRLSNRPTKHVTHAELAAIAGRR